MLRSLTGFLGRRSKPMIVTAALVSIGLFDYYAGQQTTASLFYLVPVVAVSWYVGTMAAVLLSAISAFTLYLADIYFGTTALHPLAAAWNTVVPFAFVVLFVALLAQLKDALARDEREEDLSRTDPLTGLYNRRYFSELAAAEIERALRYPHPFSLAYIDVDNFKTVNDTRGHDAGDAVLCAIADVLRGGGRSTDILAQLGGDQLAVILPQGSPDGSMRVILKLRESFLEAVSADDSPISVSTGLVTFLSPPDSVDKMLSAADRLMYEVKKSGKNDIRAEVLGRQAPGQGPRVDRGDPSSP